MSLRVDETRALRELRDWLRERFGERFLEMKLFGSRARGEGDEDSDLDVLVVVSDLLHNEGREIAQQCGDYLTRYDLIVSCFAQSDARWRELHARERRIAAEIDRDGIRYWPSPEAP